MNSASDAGYAGPTRIPQSLESNVVLLSGKDIDVGNVPVSNPFPDLIATSSPTSYSGYGGEHHSKMMYVSDDVVTPSSRDIGKILPDEIPVYDQDIKRKFNVVASGVYW